MYVFGNPAAIAPPVTACGMDPTEDGLSCEDAGDPCRPVVSPENYALLFDGDDDSVKIPYSTSMVLENEVSVSCWVFLRNLSAGYLFCKWVTSEQDVWLGLRSDSLFAWYVTGRPGETVVGNDPPPVGRWFHLLATYGPDYVRLYIDGEIVASAGGAGSLKNSLGPVYLGGMERDFGPEPPLHFTIDELAFFKRAIPPAEVASLARGERIIDTDDLILYYRFNEKEGQILHDLSGNENHGRLGGTGGADSADPEWVEGFPQQE